MLHSRSITVSEPFGLPTGSLTVMSLIAANPGNSQKQLADWAGMTGYDAAAREALKRWGKLHTRNFRSVHYLVRSKVVGMLISVAALSLGRDLDATTDPGVFMRHLDAALNPR